jgi:hypothetical protein
MSFDDDVADDLTAFCLDTEMETQTLHGNSLVSRTLSWSHQPDSDDELEILAQLSYEMNRQNASYRLSTL